MQTHKKRIPPPLQASLVQDNYPIRIQYNLYIGSKFSGFNIDALKDIGITHILNASSNPSSFPSIFTYLSLNIRDTDDANLLSCIPATNIFIKAGVEAGGVLVHCHFGRSRSTALIAAYLMSTHSMTYDSCIEHIRSHRSVASPNPGFEGQLRAYQDAGYDSYLAQKSPILKGFLNPARHHLSSRRRNYDLESDVDTISSVASSEMSGSNYILRLDSSEGECDGVPSEEIDTSMISAGSEYNSPTNVIEVGPLPEKSEDDGIPSFLTSFGKNGKVSASRSGRPRSPLVIPSAPVAVPRPPLGAQAKKTRYILKNDGVKDAEVLRHFTECLHRSALGLSPLSVSLPVTPITDQDHNMFVVSPTNASSVIPPLPPKGRSPIVSPSERDKEVILATGIASVHISNSNLSNSDKSSSTNSNIPLYLPDILLSIEEDEDSSYGSHNSSWSQNSEQSQTSQLSRGSMSSIGDDLVDIHPSMRSMSTFKSNSFTGPGPTPSMQRRNMYRKSNSFVCQMKSIDSWGSDLGYNPDYDDTHSVRSDSIASEMDPLESEQLAGQLKIQAFLTEEDSSGSSSRSATPKRRTSSPSANICSSPRHPSKLTFMRSVSLSVIDSDHSSRNEADKETSHSHLLTLVEEQTAEERIRKALSMSSSPSISPSPSPSDFATFSLPSNDLSSNFTALNSRKAKLSLDTKTEY